MPGVDTIDGLTRAVADFDTSGFELPMEEAALARARRSLMETGLLLLGEMPGVRENPLVILRLMDALGLGSLALDWHGGLTMELYTYLRHGTPLESAHWWVGDGRVTAGHLAVLRRLSPITLTLFDGADRPDRDSAMARRVLDTVAAPPRWWSRATPTPASRRTRSASPWAPVWRGSGRGWRASASTTAAVPSTRWSGAAWTPARRRVGCGWWARSWWWGCRSSARRLCRSSRSRHGRGSLPNFEQV
ncbi:hypothetical protein ACFSTC_02455 [Nonomuraea ferruginea]